MMMVWRKIKRMREQQIESKLKKEVEGMGGLCLKFTSPGTAGVPDRIVLMPGGRVAFVEVKAPGYNMRPLQIKRKSQLEELGFLVYTIDKINQIGGVIDEIQSS